MSKRVVLGELVKLLFHKQLDRGFTLAEWETRCMLRGEIHELVTTDHDGQEAGAQIDRVGFLGFIEMINGGVIERGDPVCVGEQQIGTVLGFDEFHFPNHYNILIKTPSRLTAADLGLEVEQWVSFGGPGTAYRLEGEGGGSGAD